MESKDDLYNLCKVNDLIENYPEMFENLKQLSKTQVKFENEDLELYTRDRKSVV